MFESFLLICETEIENQINIIHNQDQLHYSLLGYTVHSGLHFTMRTKLKDEWYPYDGIERPEVKRVDSSPYMPSLGQIYYIVYVLSYGTTPNEQFLI